jgi:hypothetical protein
MLTLALKGGNPGYPTGTGSSVNLGHGLTVPRNDDVSGWHPQFHPPAGAPPEA